MPTSDGTCRFLSTAFVAVCLVGVAAAQQSPVYLNLPVPAGTASITFGVNSSGQVVGAFEAKTGGLTGGEQLFVWQNGTTTLIGSPGNPILWAAINNLGQVAFTLDRPITTYLWSKGTITPIGNFVVSSLNDQTEIAGCLEKLVGANGVRESVIWNGGDPFFLKPTGGQTNLSCALGVNNLGQVAGAFYSFQGSPTGSGYLWDQGITTLLGSLGGSYSLAAAINDAGQVTGSAINANNAVEAFLWQNGSIQGLGFPPGETFSSAVRIDPAGRILGNSSLPWVWQNGVFTTLDGGSCSIHSCALPFATGIADMGSGIIASGSCINPASGVKLAACIWNLPATSKVVTGSR
jgi:probable HAF family extracellular repeat protein